MEGHCLPDTPLAASQVEYRLRTACGKSVMTAGWLNWGSTARTGVPIYYLLPLPGTTAPTVLTSPVLVGIPVLHPDLSS